MNLGGFWSTLKYVVALFVVGVLVQVVDDIPGVRGINDALNRNAERIAWPAAVIAVIGTIAMLAGIFWPSGLKGRRRRASEQVGSFRLADMKRAFRDGTIRRSRLWQKRSLLFIGGTGIAFGAFGLAFALSPPAFVKLLVGPALIYMLVRLSWGLYRL